MSESMLDAFHFLRSNVFPTIQIDLIFTRADDNATLADQWRYPVDGPSVDADEEIVGILC